MSSGCEDIVMIGDAQFTSTVMDGEPHRVTSIPLDNRGSDICSEALVHALCTDLIYLSETNYSSEMSEMFGEP